jgi:hypothetical protein
MSPARHNSGRGALIAKALRRSAVNQTCSISLAPCVKREPGGHAPPGSGFRLLRALARERADECGRGGGRALPYDGEDGQSERRGDRGTLRHQGFTIRPQRLSTMRERTGSRLIMRVK